MSDIKVTHNGIEIVYDPASNLWEFELRGRQRSAESLKKAQEFIDKPVKDPKKSTFQRVNCYFKERDWGLGEDTWAVLVATSISRDRWSNPVVWTTDEKGKERRKIDSRGLFPVTPDNTAIIEKLSKLTDDIKALRVQAEALEKKLKPITIPKDEADEQPTS